MSNFWDYNVWGTLNIVAILLIALLLSNALKRVKFIKRTLIPTPVIGGVILLIISTVYTAITGQNIFNTNFFGGDGINTLEIITYHALAIGFIVQTLSSSDKKLTKKRATEIFDTGVTTVSTYVLQAIFGIGITIIASLIVVDFFPAAGILLPFGYGQGTGQALNYGSIYEADYGFVGGKSFGLTIAALGFLCASIGGVIYLNVLKKRGKIKIDENPLPLKQSSTALDSIDGTNSGGLDKMTKQIGLIAIAYFVAYLLMFGLGELVPKFRAVIYGFNFLFGVITATLLKMVLKKLNAKGVFKEPVIDKYLQKRVGNFCFDIMVIAGIGAIQLNLIKDYWAILLILGVVGLVITYFYNLLVANKLFPEYKNEQFLAMYGMLTGTASTGIMLLREIDGEFKTPVSDNLVYQTLPAIVFGFPMMLLATLAPKNPTLTLLILLGFFLVMNIILFRAKIFRKKKKLSDI